MRKRGLHARCLLESPWSGHFEEGRPTKEEAGGVAEGICRWEGLVAVVKERWINKKVYSTRITRADRVFTGCFLFYVELRAQGKEGVDLQSKSSP